MNLLNRYCNSLTFKDYEDFHANFKLNIPDNYNFGYDVVDEYAKLQPDKLALVWCDDFGEERNFSFKDISVESNKIANYLISIGITKGDAVMLILQRRYEYWTTLIALTKIGAVVVPATHMLMEKDLVYRFNSGKIKAVICVNEDDLCNSMIKAKPKCPTVKNYLVIGDREGFLNYHNEYEKFSDKLSCDYFNTRKKTDGLFLYFTSGTTGMPKMVMHNETYSVAHITTAYFWLKCEDEGLHFTLSETGWGKASWGKLFGQWLCGCAVFVYDFHGKFTPSDLLPLLVKNNVTSFCAPPTVYRFLIKEDLSKYDLSKIKHMCTAGEALNPEVAKQIREKTGHEIYEAFGQTETVVLCGTFKGYNKIKLGSMGKPSPLYDVILCDDEDKEVPVGQEGEICIKIRPDQIGLFDGYFENEQSTKNVKRDGIYHSGDLAFKTEEGDFCFVGRKDDVIKSSGYRIGPFEVESALMEHPSVLECAITAVPDPLRGQIVKATIVLAKGFTASDELIKTLQDYVKKTTAPYKYPRIIEFVDALPKTISGKIRRVELRENDNKK